MASSLLVSAVTVVFRTCTKFIFDWLITFDSWWSSWLGSSTMAFSSLGSSTMAASSLLVSPVTVVFRTCSRFLLEWLIPFDSSWSSSGSSFSMASSLFVSL
uniref:Uncharacterized protein n=1 Tax=Cacopsylla melanoneura TaxID=428564 RepID=A0A8D8M6L7_9HEMI